eukprot:COSAG02_NODE_20355_length_835_cov_1.529891_1_plen_63_part_00
MVRCCGLSLLAPLAHPVGRLRSALGGGGRGGGGAGGGGGSPGGGGGGGGKGVARERGAPRGM